MQNTALEILSVLKNSKHPVICMDSRADFDAMCSCIIMHSYITKTLGKAVDVYFDGTLPDSIRKMTSEYADISFLKENVCPATQIDFSKYDLQIFMDSGDLEHICKEGKFVAQNNLLKVNIDHHAGNPLYGDLNYVKELASTCSVLFYMFKEAEVEIPVDLVNIYYLGLLLDSGFFQQNTMTANDFLMAAELVKMGAKYYEITWKFTFNETYEDTKLRALVLNNMVFDKKLKIIYSTITKKDLFDRNIDMIKTSFGPSDMLRRIEGSKFVFVVKESDIPNNYTLSFRSHENGFNVFEIAKHFGGGGHVMAAGGSVMASSMEEAVGKVLDYISG